MNKEEIVATVYNMIYEQDTINKKSCLSLAEEITDFIEELSQYKEQAITDTQDTIISRDAMIRELRKGYIDMALIIEQLTTKDPTEDDIKDMKERANRLKESIK